VIWAAVALAEPVDTVRVVVSVIGRALL